MIMVNVYYRKLKKTTINLYLIYQFSLLNLGLISIFTYLLCFFPCAYVLFDRNLNTLNLKAIINKKINLDIFYLGLSCATSILVLSENTYDVNIATIIHMCTSRSFDHNFMSKNFCKICSSVLTLNYYFYLAASAMTPESHLLCFLVADFMLSRLFRNKPIWYPYF